MWMSCRATCEEEEWRNRDHQLLSSRQVLLAPIKTQLEGRRAASAEWRIASAPCRRWTPGGEEAARDFVISLKPLCLDNLIELPGSPRLGASNEERKANCHLPSSQRH